MLYKHRKEFARDLKLVYIASTEDVALNELTLVEQKCKQYAIAFDALHKSLYLATVDISEKWTQKIRSWIQILAHLSIYFEERITSLNI